jgi:HlyD family secretion protein
MKIARKHLWMLLTLVAVGAAVGLALRPETLPVETAVVSRGPLRVTVDEDGETRVRERYLLAAPVAGRLVRVTCEVGDKVSVGEVVGRIYPLPLDTRVRAEAAERLRSAEASYRAAQAVVAQAEEAHGEASRMLERLEQLEAQVPGAVTGQRLDMASTAERSAAFAMEQARGAADAAGHQVAAARASLLDSESTVSQPTLLRAPIEGRVLRVYEEHEQVVAAGSPIVEIGDPSDLEVVVDVLSDDAELLRVGAPAMVTSGTGADTLVGRIRLVEPSAFTSVSPLGVEEQRVNVTVAFDGAPLVLGDRYRVEASLVAWEAEDVLRVPVSALFRVGGEWGVYVVEGVRARVRTIELGQRGRRDAEVRAGLAEGDAVVLYPSMDLVDGARVKDAR